nr:MAG TPA: hypothetical protein [Caudoviricetes sp.]
MLFPLLAPPVTKINPIFSPVLYHFFYFNRPVQ